MKTAFELEGNMGVLAIKENTVSTNKEPIVSYLEWNNQIAQHFFNPGKAGTRVWFSVEQELIEKVAKQNNSTFADFIKALKKGPGWVHRDQQKICIKAYETFKKWRTNPALQISYNHPTKAQIHEVSLEADIKYPPYIAYLALFVLAVNYRKSSNFSENHYYGPLREILGESPATGQYPSFQKMWELWVDLEKWSLEYKNGDLGEFHFDIYGKNNHVGILYYQVVLKKEDQKNLPKIFWKMGWDSDSHPTSEEILQALRHNKNLLSRRTSKRIEQSESDFLSRLMDRVLEELKDYNEDEVLTDDSTQESDKRGFIEICMSIDETAQIVNFDYRCRRKTGLPEEKFILKGNSSKWEVTPSTATLSQKINKFNIEDWSKDLRAPLKSGKYHFSYKGEKYKIFSRGDKQGVSGWISGQRPSRDQLFYLAVHKNLSDKVQKWGETECDKCQKLDFAGLPKEWLLFKIQGVNGDKRIKKDIPALAIDSNPRINFEGGIRPSKGNKFFAFAPPKILIIGELKPVSKLVYSIDNQEKTHWLLSQTEPDIFLLPKKMPCGKNIAIKIVEQSEKKSIKSVIESKSQSQDSGNIIPEKKLMLVENRLNKFSDYLNNGAMDNFGNLKYIQQSSSPNESIGNKKLYVKGGYCHGFISKTNYPKLLHISLDKVKKVYLIGNTPGQIIFWPIDLWPESWSPVWMILFKTYKKAEAVLIEDIKEQEQIVNDQQFSKEQIKLWKKIVWFNRKRIKSKSKTQWKLWIERTKNV